MSPPALQPPADFVPAVAELGITFDADDLEMLGRYLAILLETSKTFNLTAIKDPDEAWTRHLLDALSLLPYIASADARTIIDVGSGGGLPGIPLAIALPDVHVTLLEATGKKARFLSDTATTLGLPNVEVLNERAETVGCDPTYRESFDIVVSRAVGRLPVLLELTVPLARIEGHVLAIKGEQATAEVEEARVALYKLHSHAVETVRTPTGTIVVIQKMRKTPRLYPRRPGEPKRDPIH